MQKATDSVNDFEPPILVFNNIQVVKKKVLQDEKEDDDKPPKV